MKLSPKGAEKLIVREGKRNNAYKDTKGIWTIGVGHTGDDFTPTSTWTDEQIMFAFRHDVEWAEDAVNTVTVPLSINQFDALVSFVFNIGATAFNKSTMKRMLNTGDYEGAAKQFDRWVIPKEITIRRVSEKEQFLS